MKIREAEQEENHIEVAAVLNSFGELYFEQGKYAAAEPLFKRALVIEANTHGPDSFKLVAPLIRFAELQESQRQFALAMLT